MKRDPSEGEITPMPEPGLRHGADSILANGLEALDKAELITLLELEQDLSTPEGRRQLLRRRVAMGMAMLGRIEAYCAEQVARGTSLDKIPVLNRWPQFQNSTVRALNRLEDMGDPEDTSRVEELKRIDAVLKEADNDDN